MSTYTTRSGRTASTGTRTNAFGQTVHTFECDGCDGIRGFTGETDADNHAQQHAQKCTANLEGSTR